MKRIELAGILGLLLAVVLGTVTDFSKQCDQMSDQVLRLHILANSDSEEDQQLKLQVRDAILSASEEWFEPQTDKLAAERSIQQHLGEIEQIAAETLAESGTAYPVSASLCRMAFETRVYDDFTMPAGVYDTVRVEIGAAEGKNWWCVMFPPLCVPAATAQPEEELEAVVGEDGVTILGGDPEYEIRFAIQDLLQKCWSFLAEHLFGRPEVQEIRVG